MAYARYLGIVLQTLIILIDKFTAELERVFGTGLPEERGHIIIERSLASSLEVDEIWIAVLVDHDITCLEVTIEKRLHRLGSKVLGEHTEVGLQLQLMKVELRGLEEAVLEIVQVEEYAFLIEHRLRIAVGPVQAPCPAYLHVGKFTDSLLKQFLLMKVIPSSCLTSSAYGIKKRDGSQVGLQIACLILADGQDLRHWKLAFGEMIGEVNERMVLITACAYGTDDTTAVVVPQAEILPVAALSGQFLYILRLVSFPLGI